MKVNGDAVVKFRDIASIRRNFRDRETLARVNGQPAVVLEISKRTGENIIETVRKVRDVVAVERTAWPETVNITFSQDKSVQIKDMLRDLQNNVLSAVLLVMIAVIAVLGLRSGILYQRRELSTFMSPFSRSDGHDCFGLIDELVPGLATGLNDGVVIFEDAVREPVLSEVLPDVLDRV